MNLNPLNKELYFSLANCVRSLSMDMVEAANSGHPGMPMGMADVVTVLFKDFFKFNPLDHEWPNRDRFILSAGHGSALLYSVLYLTGYPDLTIEDLKSFRKLNSKTPGHPEYGHTIGVETTTGPLGQGLANAVGMALSEAILRERFGANSQDHHIYALVGDGCLMEGISYEAVSFAGHMRLNKLIVLWDNNQITIDGPVRLSSSEDQVIRFKACGWNVIEIDGHDVNDIHRALELAQNSNDPTLIACKTIIGYGSPQKAGTHHAHGSPLGKEEVANTKKNLKIDYPAFEIPDDLLKKWRSFSHKSLSQYESWKKHYFPDFLSFLKQKFDFSALDDYIKTLKIEKLSLATRQASEKVLECIMEKNSLLIGGSADLTPSNNTKTKMMKALTPEDKTGDYIYYGIREHFMGACMNGLTLHGPLIPYGGTFLCFTDYMRPSIRLSALMNIKVIYVMTHDSIGLGEDGPTHQPIEHLNALRSIPNLTVYRPADAFETVIAWRLALESEGPSVLALSRQSLPFLTRENFDICPAYVITEGNDGVLVSTGSEVSLCVQVAELLAKENISMRVLSIPSLERFEQLPKNQQLEFLTQKPTFAVEAASESVFWAKRGIEFIGLSGFGVSASKDDAYKYFALTKEDIALRIKRTMLKTS